LITDPGSGGSHRRERGGQGGGRRALHVVVEGTDLIGVLDQDASGIGRTEVLPVQHRVREKRGDCADICIDEVVVALVANPGMPRTQIHLVVEQFEIVGAHIQHDWQHPSWMDPGGRGVHGQFADGDFDSADALIPNPQNAFGVSGNNQVHVIGS